MRIFRISIFLIQIGLFFSFAAQSCGATLPPKMSGAEYFYGQDANGEQVMCVMQKAHSRQDGVTFSAWNGMSVPITIIFQPKLENLKADAVFPLLLVIPARNTKPAYSAKAIDPSRPHRWENNWNWRIGVINAQHDDSFLYSLPFSESGKYPIVQGYNGSWSHHGEFAYSIDWDMPIGTPVLASRPGTIAFIRDAFTGHSTDPSWKDRTNTITICHDDGTMAEYSHIKQHSAKVKVGDHVKAGDNIALSADVGYSTSPHLHFRVFRIFQTSQGMVEESLGIMFKGSDGKPKSVGR